MCSLVIWVPCNDSRASGHLLWLLPWSLISALEESCLCLKGISFFSYSLLWLHCAFIHRQAFSHWRRVGLLPTLYRASLVVHRLSCPEACGDLPGPGFKRVSPALAADSELLSTQEVLKGSFCLFYCLPLCLSLPLSLSALPLLCP